MPKVTEYEIQRALCLWLDGYPYAKGNPTKTPALVPDAVYWHTPNGGSRRGGFEGKRLKDIGVRAGIFDLTFLHIGQTFVLELKDAEGELSPAQRVMWPQYERAGAAGVAWANGLASARVQLYRWGLTRDSV